MSNPGGWSLMLKSFGLLAHEPGLVAGIVEIRLNLKLRTQRIALVVATHAVVVGPSGRRIDARPGQHNGVVAYPSVNSVPPVITLPSLRRAPSRNHLVVFGMACMVSNGRWWSSVTMKITLGFGGAQMPDVGVLFPSVLMVASST